MSDKVCSKCGGEVKEHIPGVLSCVCSDYIIGTFSPYPEAWGGVVSERFEADETYVGGKAENMHKWERLCMGVQGRGADTVMS